MVTTYNIPKFHIANTMSDVFLAALDGVVNPKKYKQGFTVVRNSHPSSRKIQKNPEAYAFIMEKEKDLATSISSRMKNIAQRDNSDPNIPVRGVGKPAPDITTIHTADGVVTLNSDVIYNGYVARGVGQTQITNTVMQGAEAYRRNALTRKGMGALDFANEVSNMREDGFRMGHFIHAIEDEAAKGIYTLDEIFDRAADRVIKYHFDYTDISDFEKQIVGRVMPFYKWMRNIIPLTVSTFFTNPKAFTIPQAFNESMQAGFIPTQYDAQGQPIPFDAVIPKYIAQNSFVPISVYVDANGNRMARYVALNLPLNQTINNWIAPLVNPFMDPEMSTVESIKASAAGGTQALLGGANPYIKMIMGYAYGSTYGPGGAEFKTDNPAMDFLKQMVPFWSQKATRDRLEKRGVSSTDPVSILKDYMGFLSGADNTEGGQLAELAQENQRITKVKDKTKSEWSQKYYPDDPHADDRIKENLTQRGFDVR
jgi:hypothetical protein